MIDQLQQAYGSNVVRGGGLRVYTTINPKLQAAANSAIRQTLYEPNDPAAAIVSVVPGNGAIRAMTAVIPGNKTNQLNLTSQSAREAGSTFKAFVLATAIEQGIDPDDTYYDSAPFTCTAAECLTNGQPWQVTTYEHTYTGYTSITRATLSSDNTVYAQLTLDVGPQNVWNMATRLGVHLTQPAVASIGLGPLSVSPLDMASAYATFASGGIYAKPRAITKVTFPDGKIDTSWNKPQTKRVLSSGVAWKVNDVLEQNAMYGTGYGSGDGVHPTAGKTGTTEDHADGWYDGYTRDLSTSVWMGYPQGEIPMLDVHGYEVAGATFAVPIWHKFMTVAEAKLPARPFLVPAKLPVLHSITPGNFGYLAAPEYDDHHNNHYDHDSDSGEEGATGAGRADAEAFGSDAGPVDRAVSELLSIDEALQLVLGRVDALEPEQVPVDDAAGRVLASTRAGCCRPAPVPQLVDGRLRGPLRRPSGNAGGCRRDRGGEPGNRCACARRGDGDRYRRRGPGRCRCRRSDRSRHSS